MQKASKGNVISDGDVVDPEAISELPTVPIHEVCDVHRAVLHTEADASTSKTSGRSTGETAKPTVETVKSTAGTVGSTVEASGSTVDAASDADLTHSSSTDVADLTHSSSPDVAEDTTAEIEAAATSHHTQPWFVGEMTRDRCLQYMRGAVKGQFVIRRSKVNRWQTSQQPFSPFFLKLAQV